MYCITEQTLKQHLHPF